MSAGLPRRHRIWVLACASLLALMLAGRALHYAVPSLPPALDAWLGTFLIYQALFFLGVWIVVAMLFELLAVVGLAALFLLRRRLLTHGEQGACLRPWVHSALWTGFVLGHAAFDANPQLAGACLASLPLLWIPAGASWLRHPGVRAGLVMATALLGTWVYRQGDAWTLLGFGLWLPALGVLVASRARAWPTRDRLATALLALVALQGVAAVGPALLPTHGGRLLVREMAYDFCESAANDRLYAALTRCSTLPRLLTGREACKRGVIAEFSRDDLALRAEHGFFSADYYGRLEQLACHGDRVEVGLNGMVIDGAEARDGSVSFPVADPGHFERDPAGPRQAHRVAHDAARDAVFYAPEWGQGIRRHDRRSGEVEWLKVDGWRRPPVPFLGDFYDSFEFGPASIHRRRDSIFFAEWIAGRSVREYDLATRKLVAVHPHHNGGAVGVSVDEDYDRLYVVGLWGLSVYDLSQKRNIAKRRVGLLARAPVVDARRGLLYVPSTVAGRIHVFDRETLASRGTIPIGFGVRLAYLSQATDRLFASNTRGAWSWPAAELAR